MAGSTIQSFASFVTLVTATCCTPAVMVEFRKTGVVGRRDGLTLIGALLAGKLIDERYAKAF